MAAALKEALAGVSERFHVGLEVRAYSIGALEDVDWVGVSVVRGRPGLLREEEDPEGSALDPVSSEFSSALVALLEEDLSILRRARENVRSQLREGANGETPDLWEWQKILDTFSFPRLLNFLGSDTPRASRLKKSSPFPAILSDGERARLTELVQKED
jgi:hypothetical protein